MAELLQVAVGNLLSPIVLFFALGFLAALAKSDLSVPEAIAKGMAVYLMLAIGFKGGVALASQGLSADTITILVAGGLLSFAIPFLAFNLLRAMSSVGRIDAAAVAAHYGSISVVTFVAGSAFLALMGVDYQGHMVAVMAIMETPAIVAGLLLARGGGERGGPGLGLNRDLMREIFLNGSVVVLIGAFIIGWITGPAGMDEIAYFIDAPFKGVLCLFLLDMGLIAAGRLQTARGMSPGLFAFGIVMPVISGCIGVAVGWLLGLDVGDTAIFAVLCASASYIAVPAAMRLALPEASPAIYITLSLAVTFPFNLVIGIPLYFTLARLVVGS